MSTPEQPLEGLRFIVAARQSSVPYSTRLKIMPTPVAPLSSRDRNSVSGRSGCGWLRSARTKSQPVIRPAASSAPGSGASQPCSPAVMKLAVNAASVVTPRSRPGTSARRSGLVRDSVA